MKVNIRKLTVFVVVAAIAMFMAVCMASAKSTLTGFGPIMGEYAVTGSANNLVSTTGFDNDYNPIPCPANGNPPFGCLAFQDIQIFSGKLTFNKDGTGSIIEINRGVDTPPTPPAYSLKRLEFNFIYTKTSPRTFQLTPSTSIKATFLAGGQTGQIINFEVDGHFEGVLSQDQQNVIITCGPTTSPIDFILTAVDPEGNELPIQTILSQSIVGIRVNQ